tara:strand:+ start:373 stop:567 length:195 start_codon:yes stop_codon:yes gene_type:complete
MKIDFDKVEVLEVSNINHRDYPEYCDAYISEAKYNGKTMSDEMINEINDNYPDFVYIQVMEQIN